MSRPPVLQLNDPKLTELLRSGSVGVIPTDTIYGLVCAAGNETAVARLYAFKKREHKPGTVIAATIEQLVELGVARRYLKAVEQFWPNPLSIIIPAGDNLQYLHLGLRGLAIRIPKDEQLLKLLQQAGPLLTTSANQPGEPPANTVAEAQTYFGDKLDFYVDGGDLRDRPPSTIIRVVDDAIEIVRAGAVKIDETGRIE
jgi:tRNA threonylcarbamoyl adenosine modification protein (Sua5/YciO/YrdC/YwlC family)